MIAMRLGPLALIAPMFLGTQELTPKTLAPPIWTAAEGLSGIGALRELSDGRVMLIDWRENRVLVLSANGQSMRDVGRKGQGPGEYGSPVVLVALGGDSSMVIDQAPRRWILLDPELKPVTTQNFPSDIGSMVNLVRGADSRGRLLIPYHTPGKPADPAGDVRPVIAWDRFTDTRDTVATYRSGPSLTVGNARGFTTYNVRFAPADDWAPLSTGRIAILHGDPYSVDIVGGVGAVIRGPRVAYNAVAVSESEKIPAAVADKIPSRKPAFWSSPPISGTDGDVWISREMTAGSKIRRYDRFDRAANRAMSLEMESAIRILGFGRASMYTVRTDADGLQWLEKRPIPR